MVIASITVAIGVLLHSLLSGWETWAGVCLAVGATAAVLGCPYIRQKFGPQKGRKSLVYDLGLIVLPVVTVLLAPVLGAAFDPQYLDRAIKKSVSLLAANDLNRAEQLLQELLTRHPDVAQLRLNLSSVYLRQGQPEKAAGVLGEVKEYRLFNAYELFNYALAYYQQGEYKEALTNLQKALQQDPGLVEGWLYAAECALKLKDYKAARYYCGQLAEIEPQLPLVHVQLARAHLLVMDYRKTLAELEKALELKPEAAWRQEILKLRQEAGYYCSRTADSSN
ncbi:tetratricopeptide repeat protein [Desulforamulus hydrothermalis]|uniref:Uncharacterized protein n=1 Tax=Desulforamulus hydrothermalis Lam5 = DSM 18033 TaxID=1121428 RepID=K8EDQ3_9FIRM|nr:tetratricopeptide repeat protein [Desulforamulus hydrothermalis]CCO06931.1 hypothetical protein DESHY_10091 [Desulforamulus hydrothermalis Lam5 = DSM 18033]SHG99251.1 Tetratricopeptide repeat-containing protein [Desulforamulus hydrothermalis Lam5 = DSM 18033]